MQWLRWLRMILAVLFLAASIAFLFTSGAVHSSLSFAQKAQIVPSALAVGMGATLLWLAVTLFVGRFYCSTVCPVGTLADLSMRLRRLLGRRFPKLAKPFRFKPQRRWRYHILVLYLLCLVFGIAAIPLAEAVPYILEPWNILNNVSAIGRPDNVVFTWATLGVGAGLGFALGLVMLLVVLVWAFFAGRDFCNTVCPIGSALGYVDKFAQLHIEIDPDRCISCLKCEDVCRSSCVKVVSRYVDDTRCVRCLDCIAVCPVDAIRLQANRNRPASPLMQRRSAAKTP